MWFAISLQFTLYDLFVYRQMVWQMVQSNGDMKLLYPIKNAEKIFQALCFCSHNNLGTTATSTSQAMSTAITESSSITTSIKPQG